ncbi:hypothetical protein [Nocardioides sp.]|uniref:maltokinase N-terminal cap-like domain-containing protein n=1 Tax=Nocardioides sp. TaxID=35761 RepID=UPI003516B676
MAILHRATIRPSKLECLALLLGTDPAALEIRGAYRFDDPAGEVGLEGFVVATPAGDRHAVLTYRGAPLADVVEVTTMEHSVLGPRWIYDAGLDPVGRNVFAAALAGDLAQAAEEIHDGDTVVGTREPSARVAVLGTPAPGPVRVLRELRAPVEGDTGLVVSWDRGRGLAVTTG